MSKQLSPRYQTLMYWAGLTQADIKAGKPLPRIRQELRYVVEYSETLKLSDIDLIVDAALGYRTF